ncbi:uncharacterized protein [Nothobranchius furzeri]|uniref:uncharacterized protein n=1 Tax=Nothobranchius furzeri TaxID=105023 RepID=UPI003904C8DF
MVSCGSGFRMRFTEFSGVQHHTHHCGQILQSMPSHSFENSSIFYCYSQTAHQTCFPVAWYPGGELVRSWSPVHIQSLEGVCRGSGGPSRPYLWTPSPDQWSILQPSPRFQFLRGAKRAWASTRAALDRTAASNKRLADRRRRPAPSYAPGQEVWLSSKDIPLKASSRKLSPRFLGPFRILDIPTPSAVRLALPPSLRVHPVFHVSLVKPVTTSRLCPTPAPPPPARFYKGGLVYSVRRILDSRPRGRGIQYLVDWEGYGPEERSWVPRSFIEDPSLIRDFEEASARTPGGVR